MASGKDGFWAVLLVVAGILAAVEAWTTLHAGLPTEAAPALLPGLYLIGAVACLLGAWRLWAVSSRDAGAARPLLLFGRNAGTRPATSARPHLLFPALALVVLAAVALNHLRPWLPPSRDTAAEEAPAPAPSEASTEEAAKPPAGQAATTEPEQSPPQQVAVASEPDEAAVPSPEQPVAPAPDIVNTPPSPDQADVPPQPTASRYPDWVWIPPLFEQGLARSRDPSTAPGNGLNTATQSRDRTELPPSPPAVTKQSQPTPAAQEEPPAQQAALPEPSTPPVTTAPVPEPEPLPVEATGHSNPVLWLDLAPDGRTLLSASADTTIKLWNIEDRRLVRDLGAHKDMARTALFMPDGTRVLTAGDDGELVLRALADGTVLHVFSAGANGGVNKAAISPDGRRAVSGHRTGTVIVWDLGDGKALHVLTGHEWSIASVAVSPDGRRALTSSIDGELRLWDINAGRVLRRWRGHERGAYGAVFTADGDHAFTGSGDYTIKLWDLAAGKELQRFTGHSGTVYALALSHDGKRLLSASLDGSARLWDVATGSEAALFYPGTGPIYAVAFAGDDAVLTGGYDRTIRRWTIPGGEGTILFAGAPEGR